MSTTKIAERVRARRRAREFERALNGASPAVRQEILAASMRVTS